MSYPLVILTSRSLRHLCSLDSSVSTTPRHGIRIFADVIPLDRCRVTLISYTTEGILYHESCSLLVLLIICVAALPFVMWPFSVRYGDFAVERYRILMTANMLQFWFLQVNWDGEGRLQRDDQRMVVTLPLQEPTCMSCIRFGGFRDEN